MGVGPNTLCVILGVGCSLLYAISDEFHQSFVDGRTATLIDVVVDTVSAAAASVTLWILINLTSRKETA